MNQNRLNWILRKIFSSIFLPNLPAIKPVDQNRRAITATDCILFASFNWLYYYGPFYSLSDKSFLWIDVSINILISYHSFASENTFYVICIIVTQQASMIKAA